MGTAWVMGRWLRRRWPAALPLSVTVLLGATGTLVALGTAQRTSEAFDRYLERANVGDVVVNPSVSSTEVDAVIRSLAGVTEVSTESLFMVTNDEGAPRPRRLVDQGDVESGSIAGVFGSHDGRYSEMDRPVVQAGRLPTGPSEVALSATAAEAERLEIGDVVPLAFWRLGLDDGLGTEAYQELSDEVVSPVGVEHVELVGLITRPDEVLPNELYPRQRAIVSPDIARRYDCLPPPPDPSLSLAENVELNQPPGCAVSYRYYSLSFADGPAGVKPALEEFVRRVRPLNQKLAAILDTSGQGSKPPGYFLVATETDPERRRVERAIRPTVTALGVLAAAGAVVTLALAGFAIAREVRQTRAVQRQWRQLGMTRWARAAVVAVVPLVGIVAGVGGAVLASYLLGTRPVGVVRVLEPARSLGISGAGLLAAAGIFVGATIILVVLVTRASRPGVDETFVRHPAMGRAPLWTTIGSPPLADGLRAAYGQRGSLPAIAASAVVCAALVAALVFGASLSALVETPRSYGWPWDRAAMTGGGYGDLDVAEARAALDDDSTVETWTAFGFFNELSVDGDPVMSMIGIERETPEVDFPLLAGELPRRSGEVALGPSTARERSIDVGETVSIGGPFDPVEATVTGIVVLPTVGPMFAGTVGGGEGMLVPQAMIDAVAPEGAAAGLATFVGVDLVDDADSAAVSRIEEHLGVPDLLGSPPIVYRQAVRPPEIIEAAATRSVPVIVGASLAAVGALGLGVSSWASVRSRRRDLAVARTLGLRPRQVRWSVRVQSLAVTLAALAVGVPLGVIAGRLAWQAFARQLGVVPDPSGAWATVAVVVTVAVLLALVAAEVPARRAARSRPATDLRTE
jgi:hypothetical protein